MSDDTDDDALQEEQAELQNEMLGAAHTLVETHGYTVKELQDILASAIDE